MTRHACEFALRAFCRRRPFQSFLIEFTSGDRLLVTHSEAVAWRGEVLHHTSPQNQHRLFDAGSVCQLLDQTPSS